MAGGCSHLYLAHGLVGLDAQDCWPHSLQMACLCGFLMLEQLRDMAGGGMGFPAQFLDSLS